MQAEEEKVDKRKIPIGERGKPTSGQSGDPIDLPYDELNKREAKVVDYLNGDGKGTREAKTVEEIAKALWSREGQARSKLFVRNSMRRLFCGGWVEKPDKGIYKITEKARKRLASAKKSKSEKKVESSDAPLKE